MLLKHKLASAVLFTLAIGAAHLADAQTTDTLRLNFQDAEKQFIQNNFALLAQKYNVEASKALVDQAKLWDNPDLTTDQNIYDGGSKKFFYHNEGEGMGQIFVQLSQVFRTAGKRGKQVQVAKDDAKVQQAEFNDLMRNLRYNLQLDFSQLATLIEQGKVYQNEISAATNLVNAIQKSYDVGNTSMKDLIRLKAMLFGLQNDMIENNKQINDLQTELKTLLQTSETTFVSPIVNPSPDKSSILNTQDLIAQAKINRADYLSNQYQLESATHNLSLQKAMAVPDITLGVAYDRNSSYAMNYYGLQIGMPLPFFNRNQGNIKSAKHNVMSQEATVKDSETRLKNDVVAAVNQYNLSKQLFSTQEQGFNQQYDKLFDNMLKSFKERQIGLVEFVDFFDTYKDTKLKMLQQQFTLQKSIADLNYATGTTVIKP
ncbi:TolC family protein [Mucilaginibacter myungsuensis]|uniref:TolC family protein n=1 Tax=Mucilaginibacter myungsuensis TaxID=649104 RepID=A0A929L082_9SPHI|nr:TolC family protein [Mucilaginibacter myungsuensis]MBE9663857.1 TolC family protein [Mucilaginibacter myungsuensis]MDN3598428.1 TolC family protein [Mucilaginibacter myungsuensis]